MTIERGSNGRGADTADTADVVDMADMATRRTGGQFYIWTIVWNFTPLCAVLDRVRLFAH